MSSQFPTQYVICRDKLPTQVTMTHFGLDAAKAEAERLARKEKDTFFVFELVGVVRVEDPPVQWTWKQQPQAAEHFDNARVAAPRDLLNFDDLGSDDLGDDWMGDIDPDDGEPFGAKG